MQIARIIPKLAAMLGVSIFSINGCPQIPESRCSDPSQLEIISGERNSAVLEKSLSYFHPNFRDYLKGLEIFKCPHTLGGEVKIGDTIYMIVNENWDATFAEAKFPETVNTTGIESMPVFLDANKIGIINHERFHELEITLKIDLPSFYESVKTWYLDESTGTPCLPESVSDYWKFNQLKYALWGTLYGSRGNPCSDDEWKDMTYSWSYKDSEKGREEYAYIGVDILTTYKEGLTQTFGLPARVFDYYEGVMAPEITEQIERLFEEKLK